MTLNQKRLEAALQRQSDNMAFVLNHMNVPDGLYGKFTRELAEDRAAITAYLEGGDKGDCIDCGRAYGEEHGFPDLVIPDSAWKRISPRGDEGGMLCPSCIVKALTAARIECEGAFTSGPITSVSPEKLEEVLAEDRGQPLPEAGDDWRPIGAAPRFSKTDKIGRDHVFLLAYVDGNGDERTSEAGWCMDWPCPRLVSDGEAITTGYAVFPYPAQPQPQPPKKGEG